MKTIIISALAVLFSLATILPASAHGGGCRKSSPPPDSAVTWIKVPEGCIAIDGDLAMTPLEFIAAAIIATFAMVGGAILSAAITSPHRCSYVLSWMRQWLGLTVCVVVTLWLIAIYRSYEVNDIASVLNDPFAWVATAGMVLVQLFVLANRFIIEASKGDNSNKDRD